MCTVTFSLSPDTADRRKDEGTGRLAAGMAGQRAVARRDKMYITVLNLGGRLLMCMFLNTSSVVRSVL